MKVLTVIRHAALLVALCLPALPAGAATLTWAAARDIASLDPDAAAGRASLAFDANIYDPLVRRDAGMKPEPGLATAWRRTAPNCWRFTMRPGVVFQDGTPFGADDVVFSYTRAQAFAPARARLAGIAAVRRIDAGTVDIVTIRPEPLLPETLTDWLILSKRWTARHDPAHEANGTGPFRLAERRPGLRTVLTRNPSWWDRPRPDFDRAVFLPIADDARRVAALKAGTVDLIEALPTADVARLARTPGFHIAASPGLRTILLGFDQARAALTGSPLRTANPFKDPRVRKAVALAIDETAILRDAMHGFGRPAGLIIGPGVAGFDARLDGRPPYDPAVARTLMTEAGYGKGFAVELDCPERRYVDDAAICRAIVGMLAQIRIAVTLRLSPATRYLQRIGPPGYETSFFLLGWTPSDDDALGALVPLAATRDAARDSGMFNIGGFSYPALDRMIDAVAAEADPKQRRLLIDRALTFIKTADLYVPLHQEIILWAARDGVTAVPPPGGGLALRFIARNQAKSARTAASASGIDRNGE